ncbi:hypothetical protein RRK80_004702 [Salmonella enterica]|nr:hypothetical protein [Salmonella enterica]
MPMRKQVWDENGKQEVLSLEELEQVEREIETGEIYRSIAERHSLTHKQVSVIARKRRERLGVASCFWYVPQAHSMQDVADIMTSELVPHMLRKTH